MHEISALQRLLTWLSPAFPVGAFAYSSGLETAIAAKTVYDAATMRNWLEAGLRHGNGRTDAIILAHSHQAFDQRQDLQSLADLCIALTPASQRVNELLTIGDAFVTAASTWPVKTVRDLPSPCPYPVAVGFFAAEHAIPPEPTLTAFLTAHSHAQISVAIRLIPMGQTTGLQVLADLEPCIADCAALAARTPLDDIGTISYAADIAAMAHETLYSRIFRS